MHPTNFSGKLSMPEMFAASGRILGTPGGFLLGWGTTVPADATVGYATGALFIHTDGGAGTALYCNEGTEASSDFDAVTVA